MSKRKKHQWQIDLEKEQERLRNQPKIPQRLKRRKRRRLSIDDRVAILLGLAPIGFPFAYANASEYDRKNAAVQAEHKGDES
jgi:hypothetical protein